MPYISTEDRHLTVLNMFNTDAAEKQDKLLAAMREIVDAATYEGWISSTVHSGQDSHGTANFIQWRSGEDLEERYKGEEFKHRTIPLFQEITTGIRLLQTEVAFTQSHPSLEGVIEISPDRDDYTVIEIFGVSEEHKEELVEALGESRKWLLDVAGYRSHSVLRGLDAKGVIGTFVVAYSQWDGKEEYDAFRNLPDAQRSADRRSSEARVTSLATTSDWNSYRVVHTRSADQ